MDPNATLEILRYTIKEYRAMVDQETPPELDQILDLGDTMAEAAGALDEWLTNEGSIPAAWGRCW
jgi:hypothetical protein